MDFFVSDAQPWDQLDPAIPKYDGKRIASASLDHSAKVREAVFAPMPSASVSTATTVNPGFFSNWRKANLRSFIVGGRLPVVGHSVRNATAGSTRAARRAGIQQASRAAVPNSPMMLVKVSGSDDETP